MISCALYYQQWFDLWDYWSQWSNSFLGREDADVALTTLGNSISPQSILPWSWYPQCPLNIRSERQGKWRGENSLRQTIEAVVARGSQLERSSSITGWFSPAPSKSSKSSETSDINGCSMLQWLPHMWHAAYFVPAVLVSVSLNHYRWC